MGKERLDDFAPFNGSCDLVFCSDIYVTRQGHKHYIPVGLDGNILTIVPLSMGENKGGRESKTVEVYYHQRKNDLCLKS